MRRIAYVAGLLASLHALAAEASPAPRLTLDDEIAILRAVTLQVFPPPSQAEFQKSPQGLFLAYRSSKAESIFQAVRKTYPAFLPVRNKGARPANKQQCYYNPANRLPELRLELSQVELMDASSAFVEASSGPCSRHVHTATFFLRKVHGGWRINKIRQG